MKERILLFGKGQIGNFYKEFFTKKKIDFLLSGIDITKIEKVRRVIGRYKPTVVINVAAKTNLEWCEIHKQKAFEVNVLGANNIATVCDEKNIYFIHFSTGCMFQSKNERDLKKEDDEPNPAVFYSMSKVWAEQMIQYRRSKHFKYAIFRPRQPVSSQFNYKNMLVKMLTFTQFIDNPNSGTVLEDLMQWTLVFIRKKPVGVYHVANEGWITPYNIGLMLKKYVLPELPVNKFTKAELDRITPNKRVDTILDVTKLKSLGIKVKTYRTRLEEIIQDLARNINKTPKSVIREQLKRTLAQSRQRARVNNVWKNLLA